MSKRKLLKLVNEKYIIGWDDPRLLTIAGMRRRGFPPQAIREFCKRIGVAKRDSIVDYALLEFCVREYLNKAAPRYMAVLNPVKVVVTNYPEGQSEKLEAVNNPEDPELGKREVSFGREIYIERDDFMEDPPNKFFRLAPGREVRLRYAYFIKCTDVVKDESGEITEIHCTYDPETKGGNAPDGRKVKSTMHWVSVNDAVDAEVRLYDRLFVKENPDQCEEGKDFTSNINPNSLTIKKNCKLEPALAGLPVETVVQFERLGYFCVDPDSTETEIVFNRTATLRDNWAKLQKKK